MYVGIIPTECKKEIIIPIPKTGKKQIFYRRTQKYNEKNYTESGLHS